MKGKQIRYVEIDSTDKNIVDKIVPGIRANTLGKAVGLNKDTIRYRLRRLERLGVIKLVNGTHSLTVYPADYPIPEDAFVKLLPVRVSHAEADI
jgi:predicted transcriptional regulator